MTGLVAAARRRVRYTDDSGAALIIALIFVTVVSVVIAAILSFTQVSMRTTVAVRSQAAQASAADGAAQVAINTLRRDDYIVGGSSGCFGSSPTANTLNLGSFSQANGDTWSASVACALDTTDSAPSAGVEISNANRPGQAILTLGTDIRETGLDLSANGGRTIQIHGSIFSNTNFTAGKVTTNSAVTARTGCTGTIVSVPAAHNCLLGGSSAVDGLGTDQHYIPDTGTTTAIQTVPSCRGTRKVVTFTPGRYNDVNALNALTNGCNGTFWFPPGVYYFTYSGQWLLRSGAVVGGTPTAGQVQDGVSPTMPGSCETPVPPDTIPPGGWVNPGPGKGVQFVFSGNSQLYLNQGRMELCGSYSTTRPPIAIFGLENAVSGIPAQSGCVINVVRTRGVNPCDFLLSDNSPFSQLFVQGTTYVPTARVNIQLNNATGQVFRYGVIARSLAVGATGSAGLSDPIIEVPDFAPGGPARTVVYLQVFVCEGTTACSTTTGSPRLRVKVGVGDPSGSATPGAREVTVYSWSVQR